MTDGPWLTDTQQQVWRAYLTMRRDLDRAVEGQLNEVGLSAADFALLVPLSEAPRHRLRAGYLSRHVGWDRSRLSHHIRRMERRGLLTRHSCDVDARGTYIELTASGVTAVRTAAPGHAHTVRSCLFDQLSEQELRTLYVISERISSRLTEPPCSRPALSTKVGIASDADRGLPEA